MGKKLAIRGHATRGKEVIELLQMMGGSNIHQYNGDNLGLCYLIDDEFDICAYYFGYDDYEDGELTIFTLEEFLEKYPFKVGDKIPDVWGNSCTVKSMSWDENYKTVMYGFKETIFVARGDEMYLTNVVNNTGLKIEKNMNTNIEFDLTKYSYEIKEGKLVVSEKTPKYPTTFMECRAILNYMEGNMTGYKASLFASLQDLLICRDAYWKIYGEQMGLDGPWKANFTQDSGIKYNILFANGEIIWNRPECEGIICSRVLAFPTPEMRDTFYENFKDLIESCKELL